MIDEFAVTMKNNGFFDTNRSQQNVAWMKDFILHSLQSAFYNNVVIKTELEPAIRQVETGQKEAIIAAKELLTTFYKAKGNT